MQKLKSKISVELLKINTKILVKWTLKNLFWMLAFAFTYSSAKQYITLTYAYNMNAKMLNAVFETSMINAAVVGGAFVLFGNQIIKNGLPKFQKQVKE